MKKEKGKGRKERPTGRTHVAARGRERERACGRLTGGANVAVRGRRERARAHYGGDLSCLAAPSLGGEEGMERREKRKGKEGSMAG